MDEDGATLTSRSIKFGPTITMDGATTNYDGCILPKVTVSNGLFTTSIPFPHIITGRIWLQVEAQMDGESGYSVIGLKQAIDPGRVRSDFHWIHKHMVSIELRPFTAP